MGLCPQRPMDSHRPRGFVLQISEHTSPPGERNKTARMKLTYMTTDRQQHNCVSSGNCEKLVDKYHVTYVCQ